MPELVDVTEFSVPVEPLLAEAAPGHQSGRQRPQQLGNVGKMVLHHNNITKKYVPLTKKCHHNYFRPGKKNYFCFLNTFLCVFQSHGLTSSRV